MSETAFALEDNSLPDLSHVNENSLLQDPWSHKLRKGHLERVPITLQQVRVTTKRDAESIENRIPDLTTFSRITADVESIVPEQSLPPDLQAQAIFHTIQEWEGYVLATGEPDPPKQANFHALQEWEGYVLTKGENELTARLLDVTAGSEQEEEEVEIPLAEISDDDLDRLRPGSVFRWVIGYERSASKTKRRVSQIVFRDLPAMTNKDLSQGKKWATRIIQSIVEAKP